MSDCQLHLIIRFFSIQDKTSDFIHKNVAPVHDPDCMSVSLWRTVGLKSLKKDEKISSMKKVFVHDNTRLHFARITFEFFQKCSPVHLIHSIWALHISIFSYALKIFLMVKDSTIKANFEYRCKQDLKISNTFPKVHRLFEDYVENSKNIHNKNIWFFNFSCYFFFNLWTCLLANLQIWILNCHWFKCLFSFYRFSEIKFNIIGTIDLKVFISHVNCS